jgi:glycosyltransferase involved in cell wall biosynthesis
VLYPFVIRLLAKIFPHFSPTDESYHPLVSIVLAVYNEEGVLGRCIESLLALDYPKELLEIVIGSDGSSDKTNEILLEYSGRFSFIKTFYFLERRGKMMVLNELVGKTIGDILFFVDADVTMKPNSLLMHVRHFVNPDVGGVAGAYYIQSEDKGALYETEREYIFIEESIRKNESLFGSTMGLFGGNYTMRKALWHSLPDPLVHDDLYGRGVNDEFRRKSRSASRGYHTLSFFPHLAGFSGGKNSFLLWSHKILRWLSPFILALVLILNIIGCAVYVFHAAFLYFWLLSGFATIIFFTLIGWILEKQNIRIPIIRQCTWFVIMNLAYISGAFKFLMKTDEGIWSQATRPTHSETSYTVKEVTNTK